MHSVKTYSLLAVLLGGLTIPSCQNSTTEATPAYTNQPVAVALNTTARVGQDVTVHVDDIQDSRCPADAICIRYGNVDVTFTISRNQVRQTGKLCLGDCGGKDLKGRDSTTVRLGSDQYQVVLNEVRPYPNTADTTKPTAVLAVTKL
jgi:hypothetical protein